MTTTTSPPADLDQRAARRARAWTNYATFAAVAGSVGWAGIALDQATGAARGNSLGMGVWILVPAVAAALLYRFRPNGGGPLGLTVRFPNRTRWFTLAALSYLPFTAIVVLAGIAAGVGSFQASGPAGTPGLLAAMVAAVPALLLKNTLEELTWRGFGTRTALATGLPRLGSHVLVGVSWGLWHLPLYAYFLPSADFRATTSLSWPLFVPVFFGGVTAAAVVFGELRVRTGSIWPGVVLHTVGGALVGPLILDGHLHYRGHGDALFSPAPNSIASIVLLGLVGLALLRRPSKPTAAPSAPDSSREPARS